MKKTLLVILVVIILIQFIRPKKNVSTIGINEITSVMEVPEEVKAIIKTSCADCHSNNTKYPWYSKISPVSWYLAQHVNEGKEHLNFSEWSAYNKDQKSHVLKDLKGELKEHKMPLNSYLWLHKEAKMTEVQYKTMLDWVNSIP